VLEPLLVVGIGMAVVMLILWLVQRRTRDAGLVDFGWSAGLGLAALLYALTLDGFGLRRLLLALLAGTWSLRLASYLLRDRLIAKEEDGRYRHLREKWADRAQQRFLLLFEAQALLVVLFSLPFWAVAHNGYPALTVWDLIGTLIALVSLAGESTADRQLARFRADPAHRGKTCRIGWWRYSRHPNYFFEWLHWWSYVFLGIGSQFWVLTLLGPALMLLFLFKVTGIPATEQRALASRGEDYRQYQRTTSRFIPWFPKETQE
jgi:steroid 5-alpha reductase family enzyme